MLFLIQPVIVGNALLTPLTRRYLAKAICIYVSFIVDGADVRSFTIRSILKTPAKQGEQGGEEENQCDRLD